MLECVCTKKLLVLHKPQLLPVYAIIGFLICGIYTVLQDRENAIITICFSMLLAATFYWNHF